MSTSHPLAFTTTALVAVLALYASFPSNGYWASLGATGAAALVSTGLWRAMRPGSSPSGALPFEVGRGKSGDPKSVGLTVCVLLATAACASCVRGMAGASALESVGGSPASPEGAGLFFGILALAVLACATGAFEEALFRGVVQTGFARAGNQAGSGNALLKGVLATSLLFALLHASGVVEAQYAMPRNALWFAVLAKTVTAFGFSVAMGFLYAATGRLAVPIAVHAVFDIIDTLPTLFSTGGASMGGVALAGAGAVSTVMVALGCMVVAAYCMHRLRDCQGA
ncbi:CPBP family intramembrane glutamic endopeptidase [Curtanaerobium respiraculi]|uniref:CPBP family intramembrane glutamic endopeptidase n=1 Tax=Curtanaerobium respiraculi TaxID=2949669 RepID=UPI0024B3AE93|nr:CPBP family intramembrane glutamic endopeptidase [Curtanaerobium respiraculi]